jgi:hypothetical protein
MRRCVANSAYLSGILSLAMAVLTALLCPAMLRAMNTPEEILADSVAYIRLIFMGIPVTILYNMASGILRSLGDSKTPVYFLILASLVAIAPVFIMVSGSLKPITELFVNSWGLPKELTLNNYERLLNYNSGMILHSFLNSVFISSVTTQGCWAVSDTFFTLPSCHVMSTVMPPRARRPLTSPSFQLSGRAGSSSMLVMGWRDELQSGIWYSLCISISMTPAQPPKFPSIWKGEWASSRLG